MKQITKGLGIFILILWLVGFFFKDSDLPYLSKLLPFGFLLFTFLWVPLFLFYAYERKKRKKDEESD